MGYRNVKRKRLLFLLFIFTIVIIGFIVAVYFSYVKISNRYVFIKTKEYNISSDNITSIDLENIGKLRNIEKLTITSSGINSINFIGEMKNISYLFIDTPTIDNFNVLNNCNNLKTLILSHTNLSNLDYIENNHELIYLDLCTSNKLDKPNSTLYERFSDSELK